jgi:hypothetical protein
MEDFWPVWFSLTAQRGNRDVCLLWRDGKLYCEDPIVVRLVEGLARQSSRPPIWAPRPAGPDVRPLEDCYWAYDVMRMIMGTKAAMRGKLPPIPGPPPGAIN